MLPGLMLELLARALRPTLRLDLVLKWGLRPDLTSPLGLTPRTRLGRRRLRLWRTVPLGYSTRRVPGRHWLWPPC